MSYGSPALPASFADKKRFVMCSAKEEARPYVPRHNGGRSRTQYDHARRKPTLLLGPCEQRLMTKGDASVNSARSTNPCPSPSAST
jgi:hypothetical protein